MDRNRSARRYTDNYYQAVAQRTLGPVALLVLIHPLLASPHHWTELHGAHPLRALHPLDQLHQRHVHARIAIAGHDGKRSGLQRERIHPEAATAIAPCRASLPSRSTAGRGSSTLTQNARSGR